MWTWILLAGCGAVSPDALDARSGSSGEVDDGSDESASDGEPIECTPEAGLELYERRIAPLLEDDRPSTCNQCHLSGIDLSMFVQASPCETMACMVDRGIVDLDEPDDSVVLSWIDRATPSGGITRDTIDTERQAMLSWIEAISTCGDSVCEPVAEPCGAPPDEPDCELPTPVYQSMSLDDPGDCSDLTLELVWREKVFSWRSRCFPCHFDSHTEQFPDAPDWVATGPCNPASLATLRNAEDAGYLDADDPMASPLLTKPLDVPLGGVEHLGGPKIHSRDEPTYQDFAYFVERWAACQ